MKNKYLLLSVAVVVAVISFAFVVNVDKETKYSPRVEAQEEYDAEGAAEYLKWMRANPETGTIDVKDVLTAQEQYRNMPKRKNAATWEFRGPDNIGGRTRALIIDKDNSSIMYAGGVSGGLWKSESYGQYWAQIKYSGLGTDIENLMISCMTQASNGDIYFGTGEGFYYINGGGGGGFYGDGIWKSSDNGQTFEKLASTVVSAANDDFIVIYEIAADPTNEGTVYAGTSGGLKVTKDGGNTWVNVTLEGSSNVSGAHDVAVNSEGAVIASVQNKCYLKKADSDSFVLRSGKDESEGGNLITTYNVNRLEFAFAPTDPNYIYCSASAGNNALRNVYQSKDGGDNWVIIGKGGSEFFNPLGSQGHYDMAITVNAADKDIIYVAGLDLWEGKAVATGNLFDWTQLSYWWMEHWNTEFVHADIHVLLFDKENPKKFFIASDGGISQGLIDHEGEPYQFKTMNNGYGVTQYYAVAANSKGHMLGGTQDNGSLVIDGIGNTVRNAREVRGGDGGHAVMSDIVPSAAYATSYYGGLSRNVDEQYRDWNEFYTADIINLHWATYGSWPGTMASNEGAFVTPIAYWETDNDEFGEDVVAFVARRDYEVGEDVVFKSENIFGAPIPKTIVKNPDPTYPDTIGYKKGDTIFYDDPYGSLFALGMARTVWITRKAATFVQPDNKDWWMAIDFGVFEGSQNPPNTQGMEVTMQLAFSADGDNLFVATDNSNIFRLSNLKHARSKETGCNYTDPDKVVIEVTKIGSFSGRAVTGLATDPNNPDNLVITLGNYGNTRYVYYTDKATRLGSSSGGINFYDITDNLPKAPTYSALIEMGNDGKVLVGTELGVFMADNVFEQASSTVTWEAFNDGLDPVPVYQIEQTVQRTDWKENWTHGNNGMIYIGTHGRGFFENNLFHIVGIEDEEPLVANNDFGIKTSVYPNPVNDMVNINYTLPEDGTVKVKIYSITGQLVMQFEGGSQLANESNTMQVQLNALGKGSYIINVSTQTAQASKRIIKN